MSEKPELVPVCNWRVSDARVVAPLHNRICAELGGVNVPESAILRRLRLLGAMLQDSANSAFCADPVAEGLEDAAAFWARRQQGERGPDGR